MSDNDLQKFKDKIDGLIIAFLCQAVIIAFAAGGTWAQVAQHEAQLRKNDTDHELYAIKFDKVKDQFQTVNLRIKDLSKDIYQ